MDWLQGFFLSLSLPRRTQINFTVAIDFTASNGECFRRRELFSIQRCHSLCYHYVLLLLFPSDAHPSCQITRYTLLIWALGQSARCLSLQVEEKRHIHQLIDKPNRNFVTLYEWWSHFSQQIFLTQYFGCCSLGGEQGAFFPRLRYCWVSWTSQSSLFVMRSGSDLPARRSFLHVWVHYCVEVNECAEWVCVINC